MYDKKNILGRISLFYWSVFLLGIAIIVQIVVLQFFSPEIKSRANEHSVISQEVMANRGSILTHDGRVLASSKTLYELRMDFSAPGIKKDTFNKYVSPLAQALAQQFNGSKAEYEKMLLTGYRDKEKYKKIAPTTVDFLELDKIKKFPLIRKGKYKSGFMSAAQESRNYPQGKLAYRTVGRVNAQGDSLGIEKSFNSYLSGKPGKQMIQRISGGRWMAIDSDKDIPAEDGYDVVTTIDIDIQDAAEVALRRQLSMGNSIEGGTAIVMEVQTGEIRAIANMKRNANGTFGETFNYALAERTAPGSTFKLATLISLVEDGYVNLNTMVDAGTGPWPYGGKAFTEAHGYFGVIPVLKAFEKSSNLAFAKLVVEHYKGNEDKFVSRLQSMGLGEPFKLQVPEEHRSIIPEGGNTKKWRAAVLPQIATGYDIELAPIHTLTLYNAIANKGKMVKPKFVTEIRRNGETVKAFPTEIINGSICSPNTAEQATLAMKGVVEEGTAKHISSDYYTIAGKTGTAQMLFTNRNGKKVYVDGEGNHKYQASFAGFFPADNPKYSIIVVLYSPVMRGNFYGGTWAAPVFKEIADKAFTCSPDWYDAIAGQGQYADLPTVKGGQGSEVNRVLTELSVPSEKSVSKTDWVTAKPNGGKMELAEVSMQENMLPSVVGMGLKEALYVLENMGLYVSFSGKGAVQSQSVTPGTAVRKGQSIYLTLGS